MWISMWWTMRATYKRRPQRRRLRWANRSSMQDHRSSSIAWYTVRWARVNTVRQWHDLLACPLSSMQSVVINSCSSSSSCSRPNSSSNCSWWHYQVVRWWDKAANSAVRWRSTIAARWTAASHPSRAHRQIQRHRIRWPVMIARIWVPRRVRLDHNIAGCVSVPRLIWMPAICQWAVSSDDAWHRRQRTYSSSSGSDIDTHPAPAHHHHRPHRPPSRHVWRWHCSWRVVQVRTLEAAWHWVWRCISSVCPIDGTRERGDPVQRTTSIGSEWRRREREKRRHRKERESKREAIYFFYFLFQVQLYLIRARWRETASAVLVASITNLCI